MGTPFERSLRSLKTDGFRGVALGFVCAGALLTAWGAWFVFGRISLYEVTDVARLEVAESVQLLDSRVEGRVVDVHLDLGRAVKAGDILIELDADEERLRLNEEQSQDAALSTQITAIEAEVVAENEALAAARRTGEVAVDEARSQLTEAETPARFAEDESARLTRLRAEGLISEIDDLRARAEAERRRAAATSQRIGVDRLERSHQTDEGDRRVRIERLRTELTRLRGQMATTMSAIKRLENDIERRRVRAPITGTLAEVADVRPGAFLAEGQKIGAIVPSGALRVVAEFHPSSALGRIHPGQPARLRLVGFPWTEYGSVPAVVDKVATEVRSTTMRVELALEPDAASAIPLPHALPGTVEIEVERISPAALVLRAAGRAVTRVAAREIRD